MASTFTAGGITAERVGPVLLTLYRGRSQASELSLFRDWVRHQLKQGDNVINVSIVADAPNKLDTATRAVAQDITEMFSDTASAEAIVLELDGLKGSFIRALVAGFHLVSPSNHPRKVFHSSDNAFAWLMTQVPSAASFVPELAERLVALRATLLPNERRRAEDGTPP